MDIPAGFKVVKPAIPDGFRAVDKRLDIDEKKRVLEALAADVGPFEAAAIGAGRGLSTIGRAVGLIDPETEVETQAFKALQEQRPVATTTGEIVGEAAPFLLPGGAIGAIPKLAPRVAATAVLGAAEGTAIARGKGRDEQDQLEAGILGGAVAGTIEAALPVIGRLGRSLIQKVKGSQATAPVVDKLGRPSEELSEALRKSGLTVDDLSDQAQSILSQSAKTSNPEQAVRSAVLQAEGLTPTKAQVTRNAADFQAQQEAAKTSGRVKDALQKQEAILTTRFNQAVLDTGGRTDLPTSSVYDAIADKATELDQNISDLYRAAREAAPDEKNINLESLRSKLQSAFGSDTASGGVLSSIAGELNAKGVLDKNNQLVGRIDVNSAEEIRQLMNKLYNPQNSFGNIILRDLKDALDDDVFKAAGDDLFKQGRQAKAAFEKELARAKISKFDSRKANLVRDVLENKIDPDTLTSDVVFSKKWRAADLQQLKDYITTSDQGVKAFDDLRAETLQMIKEASFKGAADELGNQALSAASLQKTLNKIGGGKLKTLFNEEELNFLNRMVNVAKIREPVAGTALGRGPSAQAISRLEKKLSDLPIMGALIQAIDIDAQGRAVLKARPERMITQAGAVEKELRGLAAPAGVAITSQEQSQ